MILRYRKNIYNILDIVPTIKLNDTTQYMSIGEKSLVNNKFFQFIDIMMNDPKMRAFFDEFFSDWDEIKTTIMVMKAYQVIDVKLKELKLDTINEMSSEMRRKMMIGIIKDMLTTSECRQELVKNMNQFMGIENFNQCKKLVQDKTSSYTLLYKDE
jgi:hypothetical protein